MLCPQQPTLYQIHTSPICSGYFVGAFLSSSFLSHGLHEYYCHICYTAYKRFEYSAEANHIDTRWMMMIEKGRTKWNETICLYRNSFSFLFFSKMPLGQKSGKCLRPVDDMCCQMWIERWDAGRDIKRTRERKKMISVKLERMVKWRNSLSYQLPIYFPLSIHSAF